MDINNYASKGVAGTGLGLGIAGTSLGVLNAMGGCGGGLLGNLFGGNCHGGCSENSMVNRYELGLEQASAAKDSKIALLESTIHTNDKILEVYGYIDGRLRNIEGQIAQQAVVNAQVTANLSCMQGNIATLMGLTKTVVPINNICPEPMPLYNSWTAPTTPTP
jgi:hypothetical protein